ncbi:hypothetical protein JW887_06785 [Candidatus Dojkabacteria bacterium]|nr:hypothetical protein [Candidatus Dojkabacteria bacterium]
MPKKEQTSYDTVFDFFFASRKSPKKKDKPGKPIQLPPLTGAVGGIAEMGSNALKYPVEKVLGNVNDEIDSIGSVFLQQPVSGMKVQVGPASFGSFFMNPRKAIAKAVSRYNDNKKMALIGAGTRMMDAGLVALWAKMIGLSSEEAVTIGDSAYNMDSSILGQQRTGIKANIAQQSAIKNQAYIIAKKIGASKGLTDAQIKALEQDLHTQIGNSYEAGNIDVSYASSQNLERKRLRSESLENGLVAYGFNAAVAKDTSESIWGKAADTKDFGFSWDSGERKLRIRSYQTTIERLKLIRDDAKKAGDHSKARGIDRMIGFLNSYTDSSRPLGAFGSFGKFVGGTQHIFNWMKDMSGGRLLSFLLVGDTDAFEKMTSGLKLWKRDYKDESEKFGLAGYTLWKNDGTRLGKFGEAWHYLHPVNLVKGLVWDGRLYARISQMFASGSPAEKALLGLAGLTPKQLMYKAFNAVSGLLAKSFGATVAKVKQEMAKYIIKGLEKILGRSFQHLIGLPLQEALKQVLISVLTQVLGNAVLPGVGFVIGFAVDIALWLGMFVWERLMKPFLEFVALIFLGGFAYFLISMVGISDALGLGFINGEYAGFTMFRSLNPPLTDFDLSSGADEGDIGGGQYSGTYSGSIQEIWAQVQSEMGVGTSLTLVDCNGSDCGSQACSYICGPQGASCSCGAWCYNAGSTVYCRVEKLSATSDAVLTALFRHEMTHTIQIRNAGTWPNWGSEQRRNVTEWGAEHVSGNGGSYCFYTIEGAMSGTSVSSSLLSKGCSSSLIDQAARGDYNALIQLENTCGYSPRTFIQSRKIGRC